MPEGYYRLKPLVTAALKARQARFNNDAVPLSVNAHARTPSFTSLLICPEGFFSLPLFHAVIVYHTG